MSDFQFFIQNFQNSVYFFRFLISLIMIFDFSYNEISNIAKLWLYRKKPNARFKFNDPNFFLFCSLNLAGLFLRLHFWCKNLFSVFQTLLWTKSSQGSLITCLVASSAYVALQAGEQLFILNFFLEKLKFKLFSTQKNYKVSVQNIFFKNHN